MVNSPQYEQRFKRKNDSIIKKGDRLIQESNEFISNLKRRALKDQESKLKTLGHHKELAQQLLKPDLPSLINPQSLVDDSPSPYLSTNQENFEKLSAQKKDHRKKTKFISKQSTEKVHNMDI